MVPDASLTAGCPSCGSSFSLTGDSQKLIGGPLGSWVGRVHADWVQKVAEQLILAKKSNLQ
jgi:hypothetical protein